MGYANNKTLTDASVKNCKGDLNALAPTLMAGVPVVWERIRLSLIAIFLIVQKGSSYKN